MNFTSFLLKNQCDSLPLGSIVTLPKSLLSGLLSFDTIGFIVPVPMEKRSNFKSFFETGRFNWGKDKLSKKEFESFRFYLASDSDFYRSKSYSDFVLFNEKPEGFKFELSAPKFLFGHNCFMVYDLIFFLDHFKTFLEKVTNIELPSVNSWLLKRIDICCNFLLDSSVSVQNSLQLLTSYKFHNKNNQRVKGKDIPYWTYKRRTLKFYSKSDEMQVNKKHFPVGDKLFQKLLDFSKNILRFEEEWRLGHLQELTKLKAAELTVKNFLDYLTSTNFNLFDYIQSIIGDLKQNSVLNSIDSCIEVMRVALGEEKSNLIRFLNIFFSFGDKYLRKSYSKAGYYKIKGQLKKIGINIDKINFEAVKEEKPVSFSFDNLTLTNLDNSEAFNLDYQMNKEVNKEEEEEKEEARRKKEKYEN